jgi:peptidoglycan/xylan/chitin deacetylase (PgdA/CDA1 family)
MRCAAFTIDVDRDVNVPLKGRIGAASSNGEKRFSSTAEGLFRLVDLLKALGISATFFLEGETLEHIAREHDVPSLLRGHEAAAHGYEHEDLTGESTGLEPSEEWIDAVIGRSSAVVEDLTGHRPVGFRAPYQHTNPTVLRSLMGHGFVYDSSAFADLSVRSVRPFVSDFGIIEVPLASGRSPAGKKMQSYLWPLHEGKRAASDYDYLLDQYDEGLFVIADHSWHLMESLSGHRTEAEAEAELDKVREVLQQVLDRGIGFMTIETYLGTEESE